MNTRLPPDAAAEEREIAGLVERAGPRVQPDAAARNAVRTAVHREWRQVVAERQYQRNARWSWAAAAAVAGLAFWLALPVLRPAPLVASVERLEGPVTLTAGHWWSRPAAMQADQAVAGNAEIETGSAGRTALRFGAVSLRLDELSAIEILAADRVRLLRGAVYVDAGDSASRATALTIDTPYGAVTHVGTQYETRLLDTALQLRVREGHVRLSHRHQHQIDARAGEQLLLTPDGTIDRSPIAANASAWTWAGEIGPGFDVNGRTLAEFLRWAGRESGHPVEFASTEATAVANRLVLRGSVRDLAPERALKAVLATTALTYSEVDGHWLIDFRAAQPQALNSVSP